MEIVGLFLAGWVAWTLAEYLLHRFDMHGGGRRVRGTGGAMAREHRDHHAGRPEVPDRSPRGWLGGAMLAAVLAWGTHPAIAAGWMVGYGFYDLQHWAIHARPPRSRYRRWVHRHHLDHHGPAPRHNYAVTMPAWDLVFGTHFRGARGVSGSRETAARS